MLLLNLFLKTEKICISRKLDLYVLNIKDSDGGWAEGFKEDFIEMYNRNNCKFLECYRRYKEKESADDIESFIDYLICNIVCIQFGDKVAYELSWEENFFYQRANEEDYCERLIHFFQILPGIPENQSLVIFIVRIMKVFLMMKKKSYC